jgi:hypothetical protein
LREEKVREEKGKEEKDQKTALCPAADPILSIH